jgi:RNA polymerase sigma-70 factor (ECF subfamily)
VLVLNREALPGNAMNETPASAVNATTDEMLMRSFSNGSQEAFAELFHRYRQPIYGFFCRRVSDPARAEELAQETFLALLRSGVRYEPRAMFRTYLYAIALKILRADRRKTTFRAAFLGQQGTIPDPAKRDATESDLWVRRAIAKLAPMDREILLLREFEQLSYDEIAELLQLAVNTVRSRLFRARMALRELLEPGASAAANDAPQCVPQTIVQKGERA